MDDKPKLIVIGAKCWDFPGFSELLMSLSDKFDVTRSEEDDYIGHEEFISDLHNISDVTSSNPPTGRSLVRRISSGASTATTVSRSGTGNGNSFRLRHYHLVQRHEDKLCVCFVTDRVDDTDFTNQLMAYADRQGYGPSIPRIYAPPILLECARKGDKISDWPATGRPVYSLSMLNAVVCFTGFRNREELTTMAARVHTMCGGVRKDMSDRVTHLVVKSLTGNKFYMAQSKSCGVVKRSWIDEAWERRNTLPCVDATAASFVKEHAVPIFFNCVLALVGFSKKEAEDIRQDTLANGGQIVESLDDPNLTHVIVNDGAAADDITPAEMKKMCQLHSDIWIVRTEWFWCSLQIQFLCVKDKYEYIPQEPISDALCLSPPGVMGGTPGNVKNRRKRDLILRDILAHQVGSSSGGLSRYDQGASGSSARASISYTSVLEATSDGSTLETSSFALTEGVPVFSPIGGQGSTSRLSNSGIKSNRRSRSRLSKTPDLTSPSSSKAKQRLGKLHELNHTETNYVNILNYLVDTVYKEVSDEEQPGGILVPRKEAEIIFGGLVPILAVHTQLKQDLEQVIKNWKDDTTVGHLVVKHAKALEKAYPPFVNYYEQTKEAIMRCDRQYPRFHAYLKRCQARRECGRQSVDQLMIRPVQRLPSMILILNDILKYTPSDNADHGQLESAVRVLREVLTHINEDKRRTEGHVAMFEIVNEIESCPPHLLSSHRSFVGCADVVELDRQLVGVGEPLTLFLFSDYLEVAKPRKKTAAAVLAAAATALNTTTGLPDTSAYTEHSFVAGTTNGTMTNTTGTTINTSSISTKNASPPLPIDVTDSAPATNGIAATTSSTDVTSAGSGTLRQHSTLSVPGTGAQQADPSISSSASTVAPSGGGGLKSVPSGTSTATLPRDVTVMGVPDRKMHQHKTYKHIQLLSLHHIKTVVDLKDSPRSFALVVAPEMQVYGSESRIYSFTLLTSTTNLAPQDAPVLPPPATPAVATLPDKYAFLHMLLNQMSQSTCHESKLVEMRPESLGLSAMSETVGLTGLSNKAKRIRKRVTRVFSNRTPKNAASVAKRPAVCATVDHPYPVHSQQSSSDLASLSLFSQHAMLETPKRPNKTSMASTAQSTPAHKLMQPLRSFFHSVVGTPSHHPPPIDLIEEGADPSFNGMDGDDFIFADENTGPADLDGLPFDSSDGMHPVDDPDALFGEDMPTPSSMSCTALNPRKLGFSGTPTSSGTTSAVRLPQSSLAASRESLMSCSSSSTSYRRLSLFQSIKSKMNNVRRSIAGGGSKGDQDVSKGAEFASPSVPSFAKVKRLSLFRSSARGAGQSLTLSKLSLMTDSGTSSTNISPHGYDLRSSVMTLPKCDEELEEGFCNTDMESNVQGPGKHRLKKHLTSLGLFGNKR